MTQSPDLAILCICTGNICRSPAAERLLVRALGPSVTVASAGTHALVGQPLSPPMDRLLIGRGADTDGFTAQQLSAAQLRQADLILGMSREHRSAAVELVPAAVRRSFTLREFARLVTLIDAALLPAGSPAERGRASLTFAAAQRRQTEPGDDDVADPYRQADTAYKRAFTEIDKAVWLIAEVLNG